MKSKVELIDFYIHLKLDDNFERMLEVKQVKIATDRDGNLDQELLQCNDAQLFKVVPERNKGKVKGVRNTNQAPGSVLVYNGKDMDDIKAVIEGVQKHHGRALFVSVEPDFVPKIPVFVFDEELVKKFQKKDFIKKVQVSFWPSDSMKPHGFDIESEERKTSTSKDIPQDKANVQSEVQKSIPAPYQPSDDFSEGTQEEELNNKGTISSYYKSTIKGMIAFISNKPQNQEELERIFIPNKKWMDIDNQVYFQAVDILNSSLNHKYNQREMKELFSQLEGYFKSHKCDIDLLLFSFGTFVCLISKKKFQGEC